MSDHTPIRLTHDDIQRAAAITLHFGRDDHEGVQDVLQAAAEEKRTIHLALALVDLQHQIVPAIYTDLGMQFMSNYVMNIVKSNEQKD